jgi:hypothetical protein
MIKGVAGWKGKSKTVKAEMNLKQVNEVQESEDGCV